MRLTGTHYRTTITDGSYADWDLNHGQVRVAMLQVVASSAQAIVWPDEPFPANPAGHITFRYQQPSLDDVRQWLPTLADMWDAVEAEWIEAKRPSPEQASCSAARAFTPAEEAQWLASP